MITIKSKEEIEILREGGRRLAEILEKVVRAAKLGVSTYELDRLSESLIFESGGRPSFKGYKQVLSDKPYPAALCVSINDEVVHSIPRKDKILKEGDVVGLDIGMTWPDGQNQKSKFSPSANSWASPVESQAVGFRLKNQKPGLFTDMAVTVGIGIISKDAERLINATREALYLGINEAKVGATVGDIGHVIGNHLNKNKLGIVKDLAGHGVGYKVHEEPLIPNYGRQGEGVKLREGMVIAIEPISTLGSPEIFLTGDKWTLKTKDGSLSAQFEHTVVVTENGVDVLTKN